MAQPLQHISVNRELLRKHCPLPLSTHTTLSKTQMLARLQSPSADPSRRFSPHRPLYCLLVLWIPEVPCSSWPWGQNHWHPLWPEQWPRLKVVGTSWLVFLGHLQTSTHTSNNIISSEQKRLCTLWGLHLADPSGCIPVPWKLTYSTRMQLRKEDLARVVVRWQVLLPVCNPQGKQRSIPAG